MNIKVTKQKADFKPVSLTLDFETKEELDSFKAMSQMSMGISELVKRTSLVKDHDDIYLKPVVLKTILENIFGKLSWSEDN